MSQPALYHLSARLNDSMQCPYQFALKIHKLHQFARIVQHHAKKPTDLHSLMCFEHRPKLKHKRKQFFDSVHLLFSEWMEKYLNCNCDTFLALSSLVRVYGGRLANCKATLNCKLTNRLAKKGHRWLSTATSRCSTTCWRSVMFAAGDTAWKYLSILIRIIALSFALA